MQTIIAKLDELSEIKAAAEVTRLDYATPTPKSSSSASRATR